MATSKRPTNTHDGCCVCAEGFKDEILPVNHDGKVYCPTCFAHNVVPEHPGRWPRAAAVKCRRCNAETLALGEAQCQRCGSINVLFSVPKDRVNVVES